MKIYYFSGTHWDREWYRTFQGFRSKLVKVIDNLIEGLENNDDFGVFHLDGQTVVLEDYLAIAGDNRDRLEKLIKDGRILIGPWYCMPDEFLLSGESLIKNLQKGHKISHTYDVEPLKYGYICDIFGHIAQMPQIFEGFGIKHALLGRGTNEFETPSFFSWQAPNGSEVTTFKLSDKNGYGNISVEVRDYSNVLEPLNDTNLRERLQTTVDKEIARTNIPFTLLMDAVDHNWYQDDTPKYIDIIKEQQNVEVSHSSVMNMCDEIDDYLAESGTKLPKICGEINHTAREVAGYNHLITNTLSSRYPLKKYNDIMQTRLEKIIEPLYAYNLVDLRKDYVELANKYLLLNHPHDSICGCSIDQVHKDMEYRFDQVKQITEEIITEFKTNNMSIKNGKYKVLKIFNPLPYNIVKTIDVDIYFDTKYERKYMEPFGYEAINSFKIFDSKGNEIPYGINNILTNQNVRQIDQRCDLFDIYSVSFECEMPATSITNFEIRPFENASRYLNTITAFANGGENKFIKFTINNNGSVNIFDKQTNAEYSNLLTILDDGEIGDGWYHASPMVNNVVTNTVAKIDKIVHTATKLEFLITQTLSLPESTITNYSGIRRSDICKDLCVLHKISIGKNDRYLNVKTVVKNNCCDHRMKLLLPSNIRNNTYYVNQPFYFVERKTDINIDTQDWKECEVLEKQTSGIVYKKGENNGFAFISKYGLHECGVTNDGDIFITLFRSFSRTLMKNGEKGGQIQGDLEFEYALYPTNKDTTFAHLQKTQDILATGHIGMNTFENTLESAVKGLEITGENVLFSTATADGKIRVYNMSNDISTANLSIKSLSEITLNDEFVAEINDGNIKLAPWEIKTFQII